MIYHQCDNPPFLCNLINLFVYDKRVGFENLNDYKLL